MEGRKEGIEGLAGTLDYDIMMPAQNGVRYDVVGQLDLLSFKGNFWIFIQIARGGMKSCPSSPSPSPSNQSVLSFTIYFFIHQTELEKDKYRTGIPFLTQPHPRHITTCPLSSGNQES